MKKILNILLIALSATIYTSCNREADTIFPAQTNVGYIDTAPGTKELSIKAIYPSGSDVSRTASVVVVFSKPVDTSTVTANTDVALSGVTLNAPVFSAGDTIATFSYAGSLANNTTYTVTVNTGISAADSGTMSAGGTGTFTTLENDSEAANAVPEVLAATRFPVPSSTVSVSTDYVEITFSESVANVTASTFTITGGAGASVSAVAGTDNRTWRLYLNTLAYSTTYTVSLSGAIYKQGNPAITIDTSNLSWSFTTEADPDVTAGALTIGSVWVESVTDTTATIKWITSEEVTTDTSYVTYGTNSSVGSTSSTEGIASGVVHTITLGIASPALTPATRYYYRVHSGGLNSTGTPVYFVTKTNAGQNSVLSTEHNIANMNAVHNTDINGVYDGSSSVIWKNTSDLNIRAAYFDATSATFIWTGVVDPNTNNRTNPIIYADGRGSFIATMMDGSNYIYAKRFYNNGGALAFAGYDWLNTTYGNSTRVGMTIANAEPSMTVVWGLGANNNVDGDSINPVRTGTCTVLGAGNWFYDYDIDFTGAGGRINPAIPIAVNNVLLNHATGILSTVTNNGSTYRHALNQNTANITTGNYSIGNHLLTSTFTATDHDMHSGPLLNDTNNIYTPHGYLLPGGFTMDINDILYNLNTLRGGRLNAVPDLINDVLGTGTGNVSAIYPLHLIDGQTDFTAIAGLNITDCYVRNLDSGSVTLFNRYAKINAIDTIKKTELTLAYDIFPNGDESYEIFQIQTLVAWGTATSGTNSTTLEDTDNHFNDGISAGYIVINTTTMQMTYINNVSDYTLTLDDSIFTAGNGYQIWTGASLYIGTANALKTNHLVDGGAVAGTLGSAGFTNASLNFTHIVNTDTTPVISAKAGYYTTPDVTPPPGITDVDITLNDDIFPDGNESYELLRLDALTFTGTPTSVSSGSLFDTSKNFLGTSLDAYVLNTTTMMMADVDDVHAHILDLVADIFIAGDVYELKTGSVSLGTGTVSWVYGIPERVSFTGVDFYTFSPSLDVTNGAYARNTTTNQITQITGIVDLNTINVVTDNFINIGDSFEFFNMSATVYILTGNADENTELVDNDKNFKNITTGATSYAVNTTPVYDTATRINNVYARELTLNRHIFTNTTDTYEVRPSLEIMTGVLKYSGGSSAVRTGFLIDAGFDFTTITVPTSPDVGDFIRNTTTNECTTIKTWPPAATDNDQLELNAHIFTSGTEGYEIISKGSLITDGVNTGSNANEIVDTGVYFTGIAATGYVVINTAGALPHRLARITAVTSTTVTVDADIFSNGDTYEIRSGTIIFSGRHADPVKNNHLIDGSRTDWDSAPSLIGYLVQNTSTAPYEYARVSSEQQTDLGLDDHIFTAAGESYLFYSDYCNTTAHYSGGFALDDFYWMSTYPAEPVNADDSHNITVYDRIITGIADSQVANQLLDNDVALNFNSVTVLNDYVFNTSLGTLAQVNYLNPLWYRVLRLTADIFTVDGNGYKIFNTSPYIDPADVIAYGLVSSVATNQLYDAGAGFNSIVEKGDIVYNVITEEYAVVIEVDSIGDYLKLNKDIFNTINEGYLVFSSDDRVTEIGTNDSGAGNNVLNDSKANFQNISNPVEIGDVVRDQTAGVNLTVTSVTSNTLTLSGTIAAGNRYVVVQPRAFFAYLNSSSNIVGTMLRLRDGSNAGTVTVYSGTDADNIKTAAGANGSVFVLYEIGAAIRGKRLTAYGSFDVGTDADTTGVNIGTGELLQILPDGQGNIYVLYQDGTNLYLDRRTSAALASTAGYPVTVSTSAADGVMVLDRSVTPYRPMVAFANISNNCVYISKYTAAGADGFITNPSAVNTYILGLTGTYYQNSNTYKSNISLVSDGTAGAVISWIDTRFISTVGFTIHATAVDSAGERTTLSAWNADTTGSDYDGKLIAIIGTYAQGELLFTSVNYQDGAGVAWNPRFLWMDYRNLQSDLYYDNFNY